MNLTHAVLTADDEFCVKKYENGKPGFIYTQSGYQSFLLRKITCGRQFVGYTVHYEQKYLKKYLKVPSKIKLFSVGGTGLEPATPSL